MNKTNPNTRKTIALLLLSLLIATMLTWYGTKANSEKIESKEFIKVGDTEIDLDTGEVTIYKWNREEYLKIKNYESIKSYTKIKDEYNLEFNSHKVNIYPVEKSHEKAVWFEDGGLEYELILDEKPITNTFIIPVQTSPDVEWWYQPPLNEEPWGPGWIVNETTAISPDGTIIHHRPPEVIGSYALYHASKINDKYTTGKIGHILRPKFIDGKNNSIWGELDYSNGQLSITVDSKWLETATYPVIIDPTIGYTSQGGSYSSLPYDVNGRIYANYWWESTTTGVVQNITAYAQWPGANNRLMVYWRSTQASQPVERIASTDSFSETGTSWKTVAINNTWGNEITSSGYYFLCVNHVGGFRWYYDSGGTNKYRAYLLNVHPSTDDPPATINSWTSSGGNPGYRYSCYLSYDQEPEPGIANVTATTSFSAGAYGWVNVTITDYDGVENFDTLTWIANNSLSQNFTLKWTQATDTFSEESDPDSICTMSGSTRVNLSNYTDKIAFRFELTDPVNVSSFDVNVTLVDDDANEVYEVYPSLFAYAGIEWDPIADIIDSAFSLFGILNYMDQIFDLVSGISEHFADSILGIITLVNLQFQVIWAAFSWFTDWATRIITMVLTLNTTIHNIIGGVADGTVNLWVYFNLANIIDAIPLGIIIYWIGSMEKRARTQGALTVLWGDLQSFINIFSFFMSSFMTVVSIIENAVYKMVSLLTLP